MYKNGSLAGWGVSLGRTAADGVPLVVASCRYRPLRSWSSGSTSSRTSLQAGSPGPTLTGAGIDQQQVGEPNEIADQAAGHAAAEPGDQHPAIESEPSRAHDPRASSTGSASG